MLCAGCRSLFVCVFIAVSFSTLSKEHGYDDIYKEVLVIKKFFAKQATINRDRMEMLELSDVQPIHVYAMATTLNEKVAILNHLLGFPFVTRPEFPKSDIAARHIHELVKAIQKNVKQLNSETTFQSIPVNGKDPVDVYRQIMACNLLVDTLLKNKVTPKYPLMMVQRLKEVLSYAMLQTEQNLPPSPLALYENVQPKDVFIVAENLLKLLMSSAHLKFQVNYPSRPYYVPQERHMIKPIHVFTITVVNMIILEDVIRRMELQIPKVANLPINVGITPAHVYSAYEEVSLLAHYFLLNRKAVK